uniref:Hydroxysteroid 11-beta-dehydrogenase 1-like protein n=1 Tax=Dromaius novaehollandiae TaxID=8790 RepID=A0A8C4K9I4_DRONO
MKAVGKVLCAAGIVAGLLAFFWKDTFDPETLSGARVLLTGASAGIGEQMAYHYASFGAEIVLTARREAVLQKVMKKCLKLGAKKVFYIPADMSSSSEPEKVVQFAVQKLGGLDYLVLNHIGMTPFQMWDGDVEHTRWLMQVNFFSYVALATAALPTLEENKGSLVVVSSLTGKIPTPFTTSYSATKFALDGFFSSLRHELTMQKKNIFITLCILGLIDTDMALEKTRFFLRSSCNLSRFKMIAASHPPPRNKPIGSKISRRNKILSALPAHTKGWCSVWDQNCGRPCRYVGHCLGRTDMFLY